MIDNVLNGMVDDRSGNKLDDGELKLLNGIDDDGIGVIDDNVGQNR